MSQVMPIWPVERFIDRKKCRPEVAARLRRLNQDGVREDQLPRGYHPAARAVHWWEGTMSPRQFVETYGRAAFDAIPRKHLIRHGGKRRGVKLEYVEDTAQKG